jgi:hypothetical protein
MLKHIAEFFSWRRTFAAAVPKSAVSFDNRKAGRSRMHSRSGYAQSVV